MKDVITIAVTASIQQKITSTSSRSRKFAPLTKAICKKYCERSPPSARESTDLPSEREIKEKAATTKAEVEATTTTEAVVVATTTPAGKTTRERKKPTAAMKNIYTKKVWNTIPCRPIRKGNGSKKSRTWLTKT